jgi:hypothetical protein
MCDIVASASCCQGASNTLWLWLSLLLFGSGAVGALFAALFHFLDDSPKVEPQKDNMSQLLYGLVVLIWIVIFLIVVALSACQLLTIP